MTVHPSGRLALSVGKDRTLRSVLTGQTSVFMQFRGLFVYLGHGICLQDALHSLSVCLKVRVCVYV